MSREPTTLLDVIHVIRQLADKLETMAETMTEREVQTFEQGISAGRRQYGGCTEAGVCERYADSFYF